MVTLGYMPMPAKFQYMDVAVKGRPEHKRFDPFWCKHPPMPPARWAKIFSPFDALKGFSDAVASKEVQYEYKRELMEDDAAELDRKLDHLHNLTWNGRMARANRVMVKAKYFIPCADQESFAFGNAGSYETVSGMVLRVDVDVEKTITLLTDTGKKVIYEFRAALYGSDFSDEDLDYIRDAVLMTIEQIKDFNARFRVNPKGTPEKTETLCRSGKE